MSSPQYQKEWRHRNQRKVRLYAQAYYRSNRGEFRAAGKRRYRENRDKACVQAGQYRRDNREQVNGMNKTYRRGNPVKVAAWQRKARLKRYGLTPQGYAKLLKEHKGLCRICQRPPNNRSLQVDHDHRTGVVRGLLCSSCNMALGLFSDNPESLRRAAHYLTGE